MAENSISIYDIRKAVEELDTMGGDKSAAISHLGDAAEALKETLVALNLLQVAGKDSLDVLLGCILTIEAYIKEG